MSSVNDYAPLWGSWHIESLIGEGSFGKVYKVRKEEFGKTYFSAVKMISIPYSEGEVNLMRGEGLDDASVRSYFQACVADLVQEIDLMSIFRGNSNIVSFEDHKVIERTEGFGWDILIRMELLQSLTQRCMEQPLNEAEVVKLGIHICRALELCGHKDIIHRDIKPENIFISTFGDFKLGDFGVARQAERTMSGLSKKGTNAYMAPEIFRGDDYGASVDTYSLGLVMYRLLNKNRLPFLPAFPTPIMPSDRDSALQRRMRGEALPAIPSVSDELNAIILKACAFDRHERFANAAEMREALEAYVAGTPAVAASMPVVVLAQDPDPDNIEVTISAFELLSNDKTETTVGAFEEEPPHKEYILRHGEYVLATEKEMDARVRKKKWRPKKYVLIVLLSFALVSIFQLFRAYIGSGTLLHIVLAVMLSFGLIADIILMRAKPELRKRLLSILIIPEMVLSSFYTCGVGIGAGWFRGIMNWWILFLAAQLLAGGLVFLLRKSLARNTVFVWLNLIVLSLLLINILSPTVNKWYSYYYGFILLIGAATLVTLLPLFTITHLFDYPLSTQEKGGARKPGCVIALVLLIPILLSSYAHSAWKSAYSSAESGDYHSAAASYSKLLKAQRLLLDEKGSYVYTQRAEVYAEIGEYDLAIADYTTYIEQGNNYWCYRERSKVYALAGDYENALKDLNLYIRKSYGDSESYLARADIYDALGKSDLAAADRAKAKELMNQ